MTEFAAAVDTVPPTGIFLLATAAIVAILIYGVIAGATKRTIVNHFDRSRSAKPEYVGRHRVA